MSGVLLQGTDGRMRFEGVVTSLLALQSVLGVLQLLDTLEVGYWPMIHRATVKRTFSLGFSLTPALIPLALVTIAYLLWRKRNREVLVSSLASVGFYLVLGLEASVAVVSLVLVVVALLSSQRLQGFFFWLFVLLSGFEGLALVHWILLPFGVGSPMAWFADLELSLFYIEANLAPLLVLPLMFMWVLKPMLRWGLGKEKDAESVDFRKERKPSSRSIALLILSISLSVVAALYTYSPAINPKGLNIGTDIHAYVREGEIVERDLSQAFNVTGGSRPLIFLVIYGFQSLLGSDVSTAVNFLPVILNPLMTVAAFFLAFQVFGDWKLSSWTAFFTACGYQITVGMYAYFLTNMLALSLAFFSLGFLFRSLRRSCNISLALASILGVLLVFTHPWTSNQYGATTILTMIVSFYRIRKEKGCYKNTKRTLLYIASLGIADLAKTLLFHGVGAFSASSTAISGISSLPEFWLDSIFSFRLRFGGTLSVVVLFGLAILGVYLNGLGEFSKIYFTVFPGVTSLLFLIGDEVIKSRLLYNIPVGLFAAIGLSSLLRWKAEDNFKKCLIIFVVLNLTVYLFRSLANLV